jgi:signal transduction histidine kinase
MLAIMANAGSRHPQRHHLFLKTATRLLQRLDTNAICLASLIVGLSYLLLLAYSEYSGYGVFYINRQEELAFFLCLATMGTILILLFAFRRRPRVLPWLLAALAGAFLAYLIYFSSARSAAPAFLILLAVPLTLYLEFPVNGLATLGLCGACFFLRFMAFPPEVLSERPASFLDKVAFVCLPVLLTVIGSSFMALRSELERVKEALAQVSKINLSYQDYAVALEERSALEERKRISRDIHDTVGYALTSSIMGMEAIKIMARKEPEKLDEFVDRSRAETERALEQVRLSLRDLRSQDVERVSGSGAIMRMAKVFMIATGTRIEIDFGNYQWDLEGERAFIVHNFIQEGILNAFSHGKASEVRVYFWKSGDRLSVDIRDNGGGAKALEEGIGIAGMRERLAKVGGSLEYGNVIDGFRIALSMPEET